VLSSRVVIIVLRLVYDVFLILFVCFAYYSLCVCVCSSVAIDDLRVSINKCNMSPCVCVCVCYFCNTITGTVWCYTVWLISAINATVRIITLVILLLQKKIC